MDRQPPRATSDEIDLYIRTYYSLLRASGDVRVRAFEESHLYSRSSLHLGAEEPEPDLAAFAYSAGRLPDCMPQVRRVVLGQSLAQFVGAGYPIESWQVVRTRGRRRPLRWDGGQTLAVFIASGSDIDDLVPILTAYQIEWNKLRERFLMNRTKDVTDDIALAAALGTDDVGIARLRGALGPSSNAILADMINHDCDLFVRLLDGSQREYQKQAGRWWQAIAPSVPPNRPLYFVSSNSHAFANMMGGYARMHREAIVAFLRRRNFEDLAPRYDEAVAANDESLATNILYYALRAFIHEPGNDEHRMESVQEWDLASGLRAIMSPGKIDVDAQVIELGSLQVDRLDPRIRVPGIEKIVKSNAIIINIDYPLGMAAFHHLSSVALGVDELRGIYIMGKAATLNGRVGDVMISKVVHDEHSSNTYLFHNALTAQDVQPFMKHGTVLDNQKALTVRSAFLQNRDYMDVFYKEGYTVIEMEGGPYLSAAYEITEPKRHPTNEIVSLVDRTSRDLEVGVIHYASDTPYSRRQSLLSKSLSYFGMESTYGCTIAIARRILTS
ncbi:MAG TPA: hypothetical protein VF403_14910, partial [Kofleriaceae bacterium]